MSKVTKNKIAGLLFIVIGLFYAYMSLQLKKPASPKDPGSTIFPLAASIGLAACGIVIFLKTTEADRKSFLSKTGWIHLGTLVVLLAAYIWGIKYLGFLISTPLVLFGVSTMFAEGKQVSVPKRIVYSVVLAAVLYLFFVKIFHVMLPKGILPW